MPKAATGSAHHQSSAAFSPSPVRAIRESHQQAVVWKASAARDLLPSCSATRDLARASYHITATDTASTPMPTVLLSGTSRCQRLRVASTVTNSASATRLPATSC